MHERQEWSLRPQARALREAPSLIVHMDRGLHNEIHANCPAVPLLGCNTLFRVAKYFREGDTPIESLENLMRAMERSCKHPKAHQIERELSELAVHALDLQRPYISMA